MPDKPTIEELAEELRKAHSLFSDPAPGCFTWHEFVQQRLTNLASMLEKLGYCHVNEAETRKEKHSV